MGNRGKVNLVTGFGLNFCHKRVYLSVWLLEVLVSKLFGEVLVVVVLRKIHIRGG